MRVELVTETRVGITKDVLDVFARRGWLLRGIEVVWHHIYLDVPHLAAAQFSEVTQQLLGVPGVWSVREIDLLPGERRRMHFDTVLSALTDPVLAVDHSNLVVAANVAAVKAFGIAQARLTGECGLVELFGSDAGGQMLDRLAKSAGGEVSVAGRPWLMDVLPLAGIVEDDRGGPHGAVLVFRLPSSLGQDLYAISKRETGVAPALIGESGAMRKVAALIQRFGPIGAPLLITGETGTGKELVARACHRASNRAGKPFLALNCAALPENLVESELFGYAPGAFSGAQKSGKPGLFELANGGTVFLDEIGEMSPYLQAKLLRFLQDGTFMRIGSKAETRVDLRLLAATHRDLQAMVKSGAFREDLYYRLNVLTIHLPPLRERREDIPLLAEHFVQRAAAQVGHRIRSIAAPTLEALRQAAWPGNVRQLENTLFRAVSLADGDVLGLDDLPELMAAPESGALLPGPRAAIGTETGPDGTAAETYAESMSRMERDMLERLYAEHPSTRRLAQRLGISHTAVANKLRRFGIR
jgi:TyrR family helix-turn-helix protein